jgi:S-adenosylmethionine hydrolase
MSHDTIHQQTVPVIALITDFGLEDGYVGAMKGVITSICPQAKIIDITHYVMPQAIRQAAYLMLSTFRYLPPQTIIVAVVDPGVGSSRKPIGIQTDRHFFIGPDNGIFSYVLKELEHQQTIVLENKAYHFGTASATFHGRDIFSPAAAHLAKGVPLEKMGSQLPRLERLPDPHLHITPSTVEGEVLYIDHFGNLITSIGKLTWDADDMLQFNPIFNYTTTSDMETLPVFGVEACSVEIKDHRLEPLALSYSSKSPGKLLALINSAQQLEVAVNQGSAADLLDVQIGEPVRLHFD